MKNKLKIGDRVMCTDNGMLGVITFVDIDEGKFINNGYEVRFDDGSEEWIIEDMLAPSDEPPYDPKTAFLSELKELLEKYGAVINVDWNDGWQADNAEYPLIDMCIQLGNNSNAITFEDVLNKTITADNIWTTTRNKYDLSKTDNIRITPKQE